MNLLLIGNGNITDIGGKEFKDKHFSDFIHRLASDELRVYFIERKIVSEDYHANIHDSVISGDNIFIISLLLERKRILFSIVRFFRFLFSSLLALYKADFVYIFFPGRLPVLFLRLMRIFHKPYGLYIRGDFNLQSRANQRIITKASIILCVSSSFVNSIRFWNSNVELVRPMIDIFCGDLTHFRPISKNKIKLLYVGRLEELKGVWYLIEAVRSLIQFNKNIYLDIIGSGEDYKKIKSYIISSNIAENIHLYGLVSSHAALKKIYIQSDIFVFPSLSEGFPRVLYEAMTYSTPIITTFVGSIPAVMKDGYNCIKISEKNSQEIVLAVRKLISCPDLREEIAKNGYNTMVDFFKIYGKASHASQVIDFLRIREKENFFKLTG